MSTSAARIVFFGVLTAAVAQSSHQLPAEDPVRIHEFYRLAAQIQDELWPGWSRTPAPLLLVTPDAEFLTQWPGPPQGFEKLDGEFYVRPRRFQTSFLATFPAFGPPSVIVIGEPQNTAARSSTPWLITVMHEHFHQLQNAQPGYYKAVETLGLSKGDSTGMWMIRYPFPYDDPQVAQGFAHLRDLLLTTVNETDKKKFAKLASQYFRERKKFMSELSPGDHKYLSFQLWQEGMARYTQVKAAEAAANYHPSAAFAALADYEPFSSYGARARGETLEELKQLDLGKSKRNVVYSFGATEGFLLDRLNPKWKDQYFKQMLSTDSYFEP